MKLKSVYEGKKNCCGCSACFNACPVNAIEMKPDEEGFLYPEINESKCIDCHKCIEICPIIKDNHYKDTAEPEFYVAKHKSKDVLVNSASGGAFTALSDAIISDDGVVYGADFDENFKVMHRRAATSEQRNRMRISKYAQSDMMDIFSQVKKDLEDGRKVLFSGTPCQNAGLKGLLGKSDFVNNLYLCDIICYGVPSPKIWEDFVRLLEKEYGGKITDIKFRTKDIPWSRDNSKKCFTFHTTNSVDKAHVDNRFYKLFFELKTIMRPSCEACRFTDIHRSSDITIADYWGIEKYDSSWNDPLGVSLIITNTAKGKGLLTKCSQTMLFEERPKEEELAEQPRLSKPVVYPADRSEFWDNYRKFGLENIFRTLK